MVPQLGLSDRSYLSPQPTLNPPELPVQDFDLVLNVVVIIPIKSSSGFELPMPSRNPATSSFCVCKLDLSFRCKIYIKSNDPFHGCVHIRPVNKTERLLEVIDFRFQFFFGALDNRSVQIYVYIRKMFWEMKDRVNVIVIGVFRKFLSKIILPPLVIYFNRAQSWLRPKPCLSTFSVITHDKKKPENSEVYKKARSLLFFIWSRWLSLFQRQSLSFFIAIVRGSESDDALRLT